MFSRQFIRKRVLDHGIRPFSTSHLSTRRQLLQEVYASAFKDLDTTSPEYQSLAKSGLVWENYFRPQNLEPYLAAQLQLQSQLDEVDGQIRLLGNNIHPTMTKEKVTYRLASEYAHQSTAIEGNALPVKAAMIIEAKLEEQLFSSLNNLADMSTRDLSVLPLPLSEELLPDEDPEMVSEVRNHLVVSRFLTSVALAKPGTTGVSLESIKDLSRIMLVGTAAEKLYQNSWGRRIKLGDYRSTPITTRTSPLRIFPYPVEVPACMERYIKWRDETHALSKLHPLIMAAQFFTYFVHIHPFADGNGRIGRALMADYLIRQGYLPVIFHSLDRRDYMQRVSDAQDGNPLPLCALIASGQQQTLSSINKAQLQGSG